MAYVAFDPAASVRADRRINAPYLAKGRLAWARLGMIAFSLAAWVGLAYAFRALF